MRKYIILNPVSGAGNGFVKIEDEQISVNLNLPVGEYTINLLKSPFLSYTLASGKMGSTNIKKSLDRGEMNFSPREITAAVVMRGGRTVLRGTCTPEKADKRWKKVSLKDNLPEPAKHILSHPHAKFLVENGHEMYLKQVSQLCFAIKADFGEHPHPMLLAGHAAVYRNGFFVVAANRLGEYLLYEDLDLPS